MGIITMLYCFVTCLPQLLCDPASSNSVENMRKINSPAEQQFVAEPHGYPPVRATIEGHDQRKSAETIVISPWKLTDYRVIYIEDLVQNNVGATFYDARISNYTQFVFLPKQLAIFVVGNAATILKLDMTSFFLMDSFTLPQPKKPNSACQDPWNCKEATEISLLAMMPNEHMVWFCYVHHFQYLDRPPQFVESRCMVPQVGNLAEALVQWENPHFNSLDPQQSASILNSADGYTYISAFAPDYVRIFRAHMPDWNGNVNWTGALVTDRSRVFISEPATVLLTFETENEVYFVLRELSAVQKPDCPQPCITKTDFGGSVSDAARLVRICKGDRGGLPHVSSENFGTFAKSDLRCQAADKDGNYYTYTHISTAFWDNSTQRLYAVFTTEKWAPVGSAVCIYTKYGIQASFAGPLLASNLVDLSQNPVPVTNTFVNICQRFNSNNLTVEELDAGRHLSLRYPNRLEPIQPLYKRALLVQTGILWTHLQVYDLPPLPTYYHFGNSARTTIIWLASKNSLDKIAVYEPHESGIPGHETDIPPVVCKLNEFRLGGSLSILNKPSEDENSEVLKKENLYRRKRGTRRGKRYAKELYLQSWRSDNQENGEPMVNDQAEEIREVKALSPKLFIITNKQILWIPLTDCSSYSGFEACLESKEPHCGWSWRDGACVNGYDEKYSQVPNWFNTFSPSLDRRSPENAQCPLDKPPKNHHTMAWSSWFRCQWLDVEANSIQSHDSPMRSLSPGLGYCQCRVCLSQTECILGTQEVINCTRSERNWLEWSSWSPCDVKIGVQTRERKCRSKMVCVGSSREQRVCSDVSPWSAHFRESNNEDKLMFSPFAYINPTSSKGGLNGDSFGIAYIIIVAVCCFIVGVLGTTSVFCLFPRLANMCKSDECARCSTNRSDRITSAMLNRYKGLKECPYDSPDRSWNKVETIEGTKWSEKPEELDEKFQDIEQRYETFLEKPPLNKKANSMERRHPRFNKFFTASQQQLISPSPAPSPMSLLSVPSTTSTFIRENFNFDPFVDQSCNRSGDVQHSAITKPPVTPSEKVSITLTSSSEQLSVSNPKNGGKQLPK